MTIEPLPLTGRKSIDIDRSGETEDPYEDGTLFLVDESLDIREPIDLDAGARLFLFLAEHFGVDADMLADFAQHIEMGGIARGAGGEYSPAQSYLGLGQPLMNIFELVGDYRPRSLRADPGRSSIAVDPWPSGRPGHQGAGAT